MAISKFSPAFFRVKFSSTFFKRWRVPRAAPLAAIRRWRNALCFRRIWGVWGDFARENPPRASLFCTLLAVVASPWGRWPGGPEGALPGRWGFFSWRGLASPFCQCLPFQGRWPVSLPHDLPHGGRWPGGPEGGRPLFRFAAAPSQPLRRQLPPRGSWGWMGRLFVLRRGWRERCGLRPHGRPQAVRGGEAGAVRRAFLQRS